MAVDPSENGLKAFLKAKAIERWDNDSPPYLLSNLPSDLKPEGVDYREILGEEKLKAFAKRTEGAETYKLVEHPTQKAKIGLVPSNSNFEFLVDETLNEEPDINTAQRPKRSEGTRAVLDFLHTLSKLTDDELNQIIIPTKIWVKLITRR